METYVARQAILNDKAEVIAYELLFRDGVENCFPADMCPDQATSKILTQNHLMTGLETITQGKTAFVNFYEDTLLHRFPTSLDPENTVVEILESVPISSELLKACRHIKKQGYRLALDDHDFDPKWDAFLPYVDIVKIDVQDFTLLQIAKYVKRIDGSGVKLLAERVETPQQFEQLKMLGFDYFQGYFFARPEIMKRKTLTSNKLNLLELISASCSEKIDIEKVSDIIERDVALSYKLLRFINSSAFGRSQKIGSLKHALIYMGEAELKKFISLLALANLNDEKPNELLNLSVVRARFCGLLAQQRGDNENPPTAFLTGMFSLVDAMLDEEMVSLIEKLPVLDEIKQALTQGVGKLGMYLQLAKDYETANWSAVESGADDLSLSVDIVGSVYNQAIEWLDTVKVQAGSAAA
ncbi:histidine kinase [Saccharobesus litoralis]|uniref:Histidine kinase n=1 Tax=Saccharobesus litoralis TaxID=2172099 RepID=A0A2S0VQT4_9ALTE|nr:HDOD domain-containing protein [Saccharobesus litoralis]AWB66576.1 histidine kinase [Saccharobesus litoralis]